MHYTLIDGVAKNREHPTTFHIPTEAERDALQPDDTVKIGVNFDNPGGCDGERFWVIVNGVFAGPDGKKFYRAEVNNDLVYTQHHGLKDKDEVVFSAEHVLTIY
jgi:hypothetical protein